MTSKYIYVISRPYRRLGSGCRLPDSKTPMHAELESHAQYSCVLTSIVSVQSTSGVRLLSSPPFSLHVMYCCVMCVSHRLAAALRGLAAIRELYNIRARLQLFTFFQDFHQCYGRWESLVWKIVNDCYLASVCVIFLLGCQWVVL